MIFDVSYIALVIIGFMLISHDLAVRCFTPNHHQYECGKDKERTPGIM
jgi:hypothetical protein